MGMKIAEIVCRFGDKYPVLYDIYEDSPDQSYSTVIKKVALELVAGVPLDLDEKFMGKCMAEAELNNKMAILCMDTLLNNSSKLSSLLEKVRSK